jgi:hypothetical protein
LPPKSLTLPGEATLAEEMAVVDPDALHAARNGLRRFLAEQLQRQLRQCYESLATDGPYQPTPAAAGRRAIAQPLPGLPRRTGKVAETPTLAMRQFASADNMSDQFAALATLAQHDCESAARRWQPSTSAGRAKRWWSTSGCRCRRRAGCRRPWRSSERLLAASGVRPAQPEQGVRAAQHLRQQPRPLPRRRRQRLPLPRQADRPARPFQPAGGGAPGRRFDRWRRFDASDRRTRAPHSKVCGPSMACPPMCRRSSGERSPEGGDPAARRRRALPAAQQGSPPAPRRVRPPGNVGRTNGAAGNK